MEVTPRWRRWVFAAATAAVVAVLSLSLARHFSHSVAQGVIVEVAGDSSYRAGEMIAAVDPIRSGRLEPHRFANPGQLHALNLPVEARRTLDVGQRDVIAASLNVDVSGNLRNARGTVIEIQVDITVDVIGVHIAMLAGNFNRTIAPVHHDLSALR